MADPGPILAPRSPYALAGGAAAVVNAVLRVAIVPLFVTPLIDDVVALGRLSDLTGLLALAAALVIGGSLALWAQDALLAKAGASLAARWREHLFRRLLSAAPGNLPGTSGGLASRMLHDLREVEVYYQFGIGTIIAETVAVLAILAVLAASNLQATLLLIVLFLPTVLALRAVGRRLGRVAERSQAGTEELGAQLQEGLRHHEVVRSFAAVGFILDRFRSTNRLTESAMARRGSMAAVQIPVTQVLAFLAVGALVAVLALSAAAGAMTVGEIISFITLVALLSTPAQLLPRGLAMGQQARSAAVRLRALAEAGSDSEDISHRDSAGPGRDSPPRVSSDSTGEGSTAAGSGGPAEHHSLPGEPRAPGVKGRPVGRHDLAPAPSRSRRGHAPGEWLRLEHIDLGYEGEVLLRDLDLSFRGPGLTVIMGSSGSGKSTLLRALLRFLPPLAGTVRFHGVPLEEWQEVDLRQEIAYVPQGHDLLRASLRENLTLGRSVTDEQLWQVLEQVGLLAAVERLSGGLGHRLGEDGGGFSGGQRQRIAVARALLSDPSLLLLDEPTSNLDETAEAELVEVLNEQAGSRLVLAVTHRPVLARHADEVWRVEGDRLERHGVPAVPGERP